MTDARVEMDRELPQFRLSPPQLEHALVRLKYPSRQQARQMKPVFHLMRDGLQLLASQISRDDNYILFESVRDFADNFGRGMTRAGADADVDLPFTPPGLVRQFKISMTEFDGSHRGHAHYRALPPRPKYVHRATYHLSRGHMRVAGLSAKGKKSKVRPARHRR